MKKNIFTTGIIDGIPIAMGYLAVSFSFGIAAVAAGLSPVEAIIISMTNLTSAGQFAGINIIASGGSYFELGLSQFFINIRYSLMGISLSQKLDKAFKPLHTLLLGHALTDEIYAVAVSRVKPIRPLYFFGLALLPYLGWAAGTAAGAFLGQLLPDMLASALSVAIYGMFIAIIIPAVKADVKVAVITAIAIFISCILYYLPAFDVISNGFSIITCSVLASVVGAIIFPVKEENENE